MSSWGLKFPAIRQSERTTADVYYRADRKKSMTSATSSVGKSCNSGLSRPLEGSSKSHANQKYSPVTNVNALAFTARIEQRSECCSSRTVTVIL